MRREKVLVVGANGQIGAVLTTKLRAIYGADHVIASDIRLPLEDEGPFEILDILDFQQLHRIVKKYRISQIYHLAAILSAKGEQNPKLAWDININGLFNVLEVAREKKVKLFFPSSIAVFGSDTPRSNTPQDAILHPETVYGISKVAGENWCKYYHQKFGVDVRSLRYPGIIGYESMPGGGTTDYAVDIFHKAILEGRFECFLKSDTRLPMIYMPDAIRATLELMSAPSDAINIRHSYNLAGMSFSPEEIANEIKKHIPNFEISYKPDYRQAIADSWSESIDDSAAQKDWAWKPAFDLPAMTTDMLLHLQEKYSLVH